MTIHHAPPSEEERARLREQRRISKRYAISKLALEGHATMHEARVLLVAIGRTRRSGNGRIKTKRVRLMPYEREAVIATLRRQRRLP